MGVQEINILYKRWSWLICRFSNSEREEERDLSDRDGENDRQIEEWDVDREGGRIDSDERGRGYRQRWGDIERWGNIDRTGGRQR